LCARSADRRGHVAALAGRGSIRALDRPASKARQAPQQLNLPATAPTLALRPWQRNNPGGGRMLLSVLTRLLGGILLVSVTTIEAGGLFLLLMLRGAEASYSGNPLRQNLFRAGHAHAGVLVILSLVIQIYVDRLQLPFPLELIARLGVPCAAILMPLGFFLSVASPRVQRPNGLIVLTYLGALSLALGVLTLGIALLWSVAR
jgi:hypothetical protein